MIYGHGIHKKPDLSAYLQLDQTTPQTITASPILNWLTASQLLATDANKKFVSLSVATYPSLTELSYVKGVTSAIQTQINAKGTGTIGGSITSGQLAFGDTTANTIKGTANATLDSSGNAVFGGTSVTVGTPGNVNNLIVNTGGAQTTLGDPGDGRFQITANNNNANRYYLSWFSNGFNFGSYQTATGFYVDDGPQNVMYNGAGQQVYMYPDGTMNIFDGSGIGLHFDGSGNASFANGNAIINSDGTFVVNSLGLTDTFFAGSDAGVGATSAYNSNFFGPNAGYSATNASSSNFFGSGAGSGATNASNSNFFGTGAGQGATNASFTNFFGPNAGFGATNASHSIFLGTNAGNLNNTSDSTFVNNLIIDQSIISTNSPRTSIADIQNNALMYGTFADTASGQSLTINANTTINGNLTDLTTTGKRVVTLTTKTSNYTIAAGDSLVVMGANGATVTLPVASSNTGRIITVKCASYSGGANTLASAGGNIDGVATVSLASGKSRTVISINNQWQVIGGVF